MALRIPLMAHASSEMAVPIALKERATRRHGRVDRAEGPRSSSVMIAPILDMAGPLSVMRTPRPRDGRTHRREASPTRAASGVGSGLQRVEQRRLLGRCRVPMSRASSARKWACSRAVLDRARALSSVGRALRRRVEGDRHNIPLYRSIAAHSLRCPLVACFTQLEKQRRAFWTSLCCI
jgi:hypothetical protein